LDFLVKVWEFAARLKAEPRRGWRKICLQKTESVADHSFALSILCLFEGERRGYNVERLLKLALLHDLEEGITGDLTPEDKELKGAGTVWAQRMSARGRLVSGIPKRTKSVFQELWSELDQKRTSESKLVHELDKLEMALQAREYARAGAPIERINEFYKSAKRAIHDPTLNQILEYLSQKKRSS